MANCVGIYVEFRGGGIYLPEINLFDKNLMVGS